MEKRRKRCIQPCFPFSYHTFRVLRGHANEDGEFEDARALLDHPGVIGGLRAKAGHDASDALDYLDAADPKELGARIIGASFAGIRVKFYER